MKYIFAFTPYENIYGNINIYLCLFTKYFTTASKRLLYLSMDIANWSLKLNPLIGLQMQTILCFQFTFDMMLLTSQIQIKGLMPDMSAAILSLFGARVCGSAEFLPDSLTSRAHLSVMAIHTILFNHLKLNRSAKIAISGHSFRSSCPSVDHTFSERHSPDGLRQVGCSKMVKMTWSFACYRYKM